MSPDNASFAAGVIDFPRVSGDEPNLETASLDMLRFSPRERG